MGVFRQFATREYLVCPAKGKSEQFPEKVNNLTYLNCHPYSWGRDLRLFNTSLILWLHHLHRMVLFSVTMMRVPQ